MPNETPAPMPTWRPISAWHAMADALRPLSVLLNASLTGNADSYPFPNSCELERCLDQIHELAEAGRMKVNAFRYIAPGNAPGHVEVTGDVAEVDDTLLLASLALAPRDARTSNESQEIIHALAGRIRGLYDKLVSREGIYDGWDGEWLETRMAKEMAHA